MTVLHYGDLPTTKELFMQQLVDSPPPEIALDIETISLKERMPIGFGIAINPREAWYFTTYPENDPEIELVLPLLRNPKIKKVFHNAPFDLRGFPLIAEIDSTNIADTNVMARLLGRQETQLTVLSEEVGITGSTPAKEMLAGGKTMLDIPHEDVAAHCAKDCQITIALYHKYIDDINPEYFAVEMEAIPILIAMSLRGLKINQQDRADVQIKLETEVEFYRRICAEDDFNPASNPQVGYILAKRGNFLPFTRTKKSYCVNEEQLEYLDDPLAAAVLNFRKANKLLTTYIRPLEHEDRIYTEYNLDAVVGRISSARRNLQNIPPATADSKGVRYIFMPDSGCFTAGDYSQEHLRILMHFSGDREMERVYLHGDHNGDIHAKTARELNISRRLAKIVNFSIPYGGTPKTISQRAKIRDMKRCAHFLDEWFKTYKGAAEWCRGAQEYGLRHGKALPTLFGREIVIPEEMSAWGKVDVEAMRRKGVNYPILGSDGEIIKRALIICKNYDLPLSITIHDELVCDGDIEFPVEELENVAPMHIPFDVSKSDRWV